MCCQWKHILCSSKIYLEFMTHGIEHLENYRIFRYQIITADNRTRTNHFSQFLPFNSIRFIRFGVLLKIRIFFFCFCHASPLCRTLICMISLKRAICGSQFYWYIVKMVAFCVVVPDDVFDLPFTFESFH